MTRFHERDAYAADTRTLEERNVNAALPQCKRKMQATDATACNGDALTALQNSFAVQPEFLIQFAAVQGLCPTSISRFVP